MAAKSYNPFVKKETFWFSINRGYSPDLIPIKSTGKPIGYLSVIAPIPKSTFKCMHVKELSWITTS